MKAFDKLIKFSKLYIYCFPKARDFCINFLQLTKQLLVNCRIAGEGTPLRTILSPIESF